ncbi:MAG: hypothetical protein CMH22_16515 [Methylophaga sp.]|uniref:hypothetical protein n=1 Tax=Methylophaga sp. UBA678 TaxID=1946901 RepID=UPI000C468242|nr:hypothetical protein [Methylophaga sp. UBA678]MAX53582.1 hypothetical protein [Methylophaga sp.]|tara:strand:- start:12127 stop:12852 length:726 start_codon:yes stop_codon:yes gene_type:complete
MNEYCKHRILSFYTLFRERQFEQDDVAFFLILIRDYSQKGSIIREVADFLAHPEEKNKGILLKRVEKIVPKMEEYIGQVNSNDTISHTRPPIFSGLSFHKEIITGIRRAFQKVGLKNVAISESDIEYREFIFCLIFLLSGFKLKFGNASIELTVLYSRDLILIANCPIHKYQNSFAQLPVLLLKDVWPDANPNGFGHVLEQHIVKRFHNGFLAAVNYEFDKYDLLLEAKNSTYGTVWPMYT